MSAVSDEGYYEKRERIFEVLTSQFEDRILFLQFIKDFMERFVGFEPVCSKCKESMFDEEKCYCEACYNEAVESGIEVDSLKDEIEELEKEIQDLNEEISDSNLRIQELETEVAELNVDIEEMKHVGSD